MKIVQALKCLHGFIAKYVAKPFRIRKPRTMTFMVLNS